MANMIYKLVLLVLLSGTICASSKWIFLKKQSPVNSVDDDFTVDCSTNRINVRTSILKMHSGQWLTLPHQYLKTVTIVKKGDIFTILDFTLPDTGNYKCRATDSTGKTIESPPFFLISNFRHLPIVSVNPRGRVKVQEREAMNFSCESVRPSSLTWYKVVGKTDVPVPANKILTVYGPGVQKVILEIKQVKKSDAGDYKCVLRKGGQQKYELVSLDVLPYVFKFVAPKPDKAIVPIEMASYLTMNCTTSDPKAGTSIYHKIMNGGVWRKLNQSEYTKKDSVYSVQISVMYAGHFKCSATNSKGTNIEWPNNGGILVIPFVLRVPKLTVSPGQEKILTVGESFNFICSSEVNTNLKWFKVGVDKSGSEYLVPVSKTFTRKMGVTMQLILKIVNAKKSDSGVYKCVLKFGNRQKYGFASLKVYDIQPPKIIAIQNKTPVVKIDTNITIGCIAEGHPRPIVNWYKNGKPINVPACAFANRGRKCASSKYTLVINSLTSTSVQSRLTIHKFNENEAVSFTCNAFNKYGNVTADAVVTPDIFRFLTPKFKKIPALQVVTFGGNVIIDCTTSDPKANSSLYYRRGSSWDSVPKSGKPGYVYTISNFSVHDSGHYKCMAFNSSGYKIEWPGAWGLYLLPDIVKAPEMTVSPMKEQIITAGENLNFTCSSAARTQLKWYREGVTRNTFKPVLGYKTINVSGPKKNQLILKIINATVSDTGFYRCSMNFRGEKDFRMVSVKVYDKKPFRIISYSGQHDSIVIKSGVLLKCVFEGYPKASVQWYKDGQKITVPGCQVALDVKTCNSKKYRMKLHSLSSSRVRSALKVKGFNQRSDAGVYRCIGTSFTRTVSADMNVGI